MSSLSATYSSLSAEFKSKYSAEEFQDLEINPNICMILKNKNAERDIQFLEIFNIIQIHPNISRDSVFMQYYTFLVYFLIYGCCLGPKFKKYMVLPSSYKDNVLLRYFVDEYHEMQQSQLKYRYGHSVRNSIINGLQKNDVINDIAILIADFTSFHFEDVFFEMSHLLDVCDTGLDQSRRFCYSYEVSPRPRNETSFWGLMVPKLLSLPEFIGAESNLQYFGNQMLFRNIKWKPVEHHPIMISGLYGGGLVTTGTMSIKPWTDCIGFIELFESFEELWIENGTNIGDILEKSMGLGPLDILLKIGIDDNHDIPLVEKHIDYVFTNFIMKYCGNNEYILRKLLLQIIMNTFMALETSNEQLIHKLAEIENKIIDVIDLDELMKTPFARWAHGFKKAQAEHEILNGFNLWRGRD